MMLEREHCDLAYASPLWMSTFSALKHLDCSMMRPSQFILIESIVCPKAVNLYAPYRCGFHASINHGLTPRFVHSGPRLDSQP